MEKQSMIVSERIMYIMKCINERGVVNIREVAKELKISETTVRRDFERLEKQGRLKRVQGGAILAGGDAELIENAQLSLRLKTNVNVKPKQAVGVHAASFVNEGETVFLDDGTSILPIAEILMRKRVHIVTYSTLILEKARNPIADLFLVGGQFEPHYGMLLGPIALEMLERFNFDHAFIGCFGLSLEQNKAFSLETDCMSLKMAAISNATKKHLVLDDSKFNRKGFYAFSNLESFDNIICNKTEYIQSIEELPSNLTLVEPI